MALGFSLYVFVDSQRRDRRDIFLKVNEYLTNDDILRGRHILFQKVTDEASVEHLNVHDFRDVNRAITAYNMLALYVKNQYVDERDVMDMWAIPIYRAWRVAQPFITYREHAHGYNPWPYFELLAQKSKEELIRKGENIDLMERTA
jgi:hypothetical protein